jgi:hypothetical protein
MNACHIFTALCLLAFFSKQKKKLEIVVFVFVQRHSTLLSVSYVAQKRGVLCTDCKLPPELGLKCRQFMGLSMILPIQTNKEGDFVSFVYSTNYYNTAVARKRLLRYSFCSTRLT